MANELSKRTRFEVFKRDAFTCQYCGRTPPVVVLHVDHIIAKANGGGNGIDNLVTSCCDCNLGKSDVPLTCVPTGISERAELIQEKHEQLQAYKKLLKSVERAKERDMETVSEHFTMLYPGFVLSDRFQHASVGPFLKHFTADQLCEFFDKAAGMCGENRDAAIKYFCGICWRRIKKDGRYPDKET